MTTPDATTALLERLERCIVAFESVAAGLGSQPTAHKDRDALLTANEAAAVLKVSRKAIYAMVERGQVPGVVRLGQRKLRFDRAKLLSWFQRASSPDRSR